MESQKSFTLIMVLNMLVPSSLISAPLGVSPMRPQTLTIHHQMDLQSHVWNQWSMCSNVLSTVVPIHSLPSWHSELLHLMPSSHQLLSSCTNANLKLPTLPKSATLTWQPSKFVIGLLPVLIPSNHRQISMASLAPLYAGHLVAMYGTLCKIWVPTTVLHVLPKDSYQVCTSASMVYCCTRWHLHEWSVKPADTVPDTTTTTPHAPARPHVSVPQPAPTKPAQSAQPTPVAPI